VARQRSFPAYPQARRSGDLQAGIHAFTAGRDLRGPESGALFLDSGQKRAGMTTATGGVEKTMAVPMAMATVKERRRFH